MSKYILGIFMIPFLLCCEKEHQKSEESIIDTTSTTIRYDTIVIGEYFPVYPNSYWKYVDSFGDTSVIKTDTAYTFWTHINWRHSPVDTTKYYVSKYNGKVVVKYKIFLEWATSYHESEWETILPDKLNEGNLFYKFNIFPYDYYSGKVQSIDTSLIINSIKYDSIIEVLEYKGPTVGMYPIGKTYYAKNIGIVKTVSCSSQNFDSIISEKYLIDYHIGR